MEGSGTQRFACHSCPPASGDSRVWIRLGAAALLAMNVMTVSLSLNVSETERGERAVLVALLIAGTLAVGLLTGASLVRNAWKDLRHLRTTTETLFLLGTGGALALSLYSSWRGEGPIYFDVVSILLVVYALSRRIVARSQEAALAALDAHTGTEFYDVLAPGQGTRRVPATEIRAGDVVLVKAGQRIPVDGIVVSGEACVQEASLSGEAFLASRRPGDAVLAGTFPADGAFQVRASAAVEASEAGRVLDAVRRAIENPARTVLLADRLARWFVPLVLFATLAVFAGWYIAADLPTALIHGLSALLIACPCALGFATPLTFWSAIRRLSELGLEVRGGETIERLASVDTAILDKTGTLTATDLKLAEFRVLDTAPAPEADIRRMVAAAQRASGHPIARAFEEIDAGDAANPFTAGSLRILPGAGFTAGVSRPGESPREITVTLPEALEAPLLLEPPDEPAGAFRRVIILVDGRPSALALIAEHLHPSSVAAMEDFRRGGIRTILATGDAAERAALIPADERHTRMRPTEKLALVERLQREGRNVLFVGDGLNDAAAMAASHASIAAPDSSGLTEGVAAAVLRTPNLKLAPQAIAVSREAVRIARSNLFFAAGYNLAGMAVAGAGWLHPVTAAIIMTCSSLFVSWRAASLLHEESE